MPWSPLAGGFLDGKYERGEEIPEGTRAADDEYTERRLTDENWRVLDVVRELADEKDATPAQVSLAWLRRFKEKAPRFSAGMNPTRPLTNRRR